ncbi:amidohydrolase, partial [Vibrio sp. 10N.286.51.F4]
MFDKEYNAWKQLDDDGLLTANVALSWGWPTSNNMSQDETQKAFMDMVKPSSGHLYSKFAKMTLDGIPPTKTAAMLAPYS